MGGEDAITVEGGEEGGVAGEEREGVGDRRMLEEGRTDNEIHEYMVTRYGDFVLYRPPVKGVTLVT